jgi:hypothetical protein
LISSEAFGNAISGSGFLKKRVEEVIGAETDPMKKVEKIFEYVRNEIEWNGENDFLADNLKDIFEKKKGTTGDINIALGAMLDKAGLMVDMVLLSTRDHGFIRQQYPMSRQFNYVVCLPRVNGVPIFLDATDRFLPINVLPERCLNGSGLVISNNFHGWVNLETKTKERTVTNADFSLQPDNELVGTLSVSRDGYDASNKRREYLRSGEQEYLKNMSGAKVNWQFEKSTFENIKEIDKPLKENHQVTIADHITLAGNVMYINPFVTGQMQQNPFKLEQREYPVDYGSLKEKMYMCKITIPGDYEVDELPESKIITLPGSAAKYIYNLSITGNIINLTSNLQVNRNIFTQEEYPNLREFYNIVVAKQAEQIVIRKKQ